MDPKIVLLYLRCRTPPYPPFHQLPLRGIWINLTKSGILVPAFSAVQRDHGSRSAEKRRNRSRSPRRSRRSPSRSRSRSYSPRRRDRSDYTFDGRDADDGYRLHVADLDSQASKRDLEKLFGKYGPLKEIWMARSVPCFAFVVYRHREDAEEAQRKVDGQEVCSRRVRVTIAKPRTRGRGRRGFDPGMRCYQCGERGHFSRDCSDTKFGYRRPPSPRRYRDDRYRDDRHDDRRDRRHRY